MSEGIRVLLVDDQELIRLGFRLVVDAEPDMHVVGEAENGDAAIAAVGELHPDVVLMDVRMPGTDGIAATTAIVREHPLTRVLVLTTFDLDEYALGAITAGASGFLLKDARREELLAAIRAIHRGDAALSPRATRLLIDRLDADRQAEPGRAPAVGADPTAAATSLTSLTSREHDVFRAIAEGLSNAEIAQRLFLSESTVKTHVSHVLAKLGARDRIHAVIIAHRVGVG